jgi:Spy/CpxP family protein refolding chaperone
MNLGFLGTAAYYWRGWHQHPESSHASEGMLHKELQLSDVQAQQFDRLRTDLQKEIEGPRAEMRELRKSFLELLASPEPDRAAIERHLAEMSRVQSRIQRAVADHFLAEKRLLSPAQQAKFLDMLRQRFEREDHHGMGAMGPIPLPPPGERHGGEKAK